MFLGQYLCGKFLAAAALRTHTQLETECLD
jgi:hypothetical protein